MVVSVCSGRRCIGRLRVIVGMRVKWFGRGIKNNKATMPDLGGRSRDKEPRDHIGQMLLSPDSICNADSQPASVKRFPVHHFVEMLTCSINQMSRCQLSYNVRSLTLSLTLPCIFKMRAFVGLSISLSKRDSMKRATNSRLGFLYHYLISICINVVSKPFFCIG